MPYQGSFLILGGWCNSCSDRYLDTVIRYTENGEWETLPMRLVMGKISHTVIAKPPVKVCETNKLSLLVCHPRFFLFLPVCLPIIQGAWTAMTTPNGTLF